MFSEALGGPLDLICRNVEENIEIRGRQADEFRGFRALVAVDELVEVEVDLFKCMSVAGDQPRNRVGQGAVEVEECERSHRGEPRSGGAQLTAPAILPP